MPLLLSASNNLATTVPILDAVLPPLDNPLSLKCSGQVKMIVAIPSPTSHGPGMDEARIQELASQLATARDLLEAKTAEADKATKKARTLAVRVRKLALKGKLQDKRARRMPIEGENGTAIKIEGGDADKQGGVNNDRHPGVAATSRKATSTPNPAHKNRIRRQRQRQHQRRRGTPAVAPCPHVVHAAQDPAVVNARAAPLHEPVDVDVDDTPKAPRTVRFCLHDISPSTADIVQEDQPVVSAASKVAPKPAIKRVNGEARTSAAEDEAVWASQVKGLTTKLKRHETELGECNSTIAGLKLANERLTSNCADLERRLAAAEARLAETAPIDSTEPRSSTTVLSDTETSMENDVLDEPAECPICYELLPEERTFLGCCNKRVCTTCIDWTEKEFVCTECFSEHDLTSDTVAHSRRCLPAPRCE